MEYDNKLMEKFVQMIKATGGIKIDSAAKFLGIDDKTVTKMAGVLSEHDIIKVDYTIVGETIFKPGPNINKRVEEEIQEITSEKEVWVPKEQKKPLEEIKNNEDKTERVDKVIDEIRKRIQEKKYNKK